MNILENMTVWFPSKDRACQAHGLLSSIVLNWQNLPAVKVTYEYSNEKFKEGYDKLKEMWPDVQWEEGSDLYPDFLRNLCAIDTKYVCFCTDDCVFFQDVDLTDSDLDFVFDDKVFCFTFRLGKNCIIQDYNSGARQDEINAEEHGRFIKWNYKKYSDVANPGYPFSIDAHCFITKEISYYSRLLAGSATQMRSWEGICNGGQNRHFITKGYMASYPHSKAFSNPINCVQNPPLASSYRIAISADELNNKFLAGEEINVEAVRNARIVGAHQELSFEFKKSEYVKS